MARTGLSSPKHGKEDDKPHVGGNTWAGGTGGSDTAGLGGRGGPYRLDKGHKVLMPGLNYDAVMHLLFHICYDHLLSKASLVLHCYDHSLNKASLVLHYYDHV